MKIVKECQFILLPTERVSQIYIQNEKLYFERYPIRAIYAGNQFLYILSDDEIKEGDWILSLLDKQIGKIRKQEMVTDMISNVCKKVIATTNPELKISKYSHESQDLMKVSVYKDEKLSSISQSDIEYIINLYNTNKEKKTDKKFTLQDVYSILAFTERETRHNKRGVKEFVTGEVALNYRIVEEWSKENPITKEQPKNDTVMVEYESDGLPSKQIKIGDVDLTEFNDTPYKPKLKDGSIVIHQ